VAGVRGSCELRPIGNAKLRMHDLPALTNTS